MAVIGLFGLCMEPMCDELRGRVTFLHLVTRPPTIRSRRDTPPPLAGGPEPSKEKQTFDDVMPLRVGGDGLCCRCPAIAAWAHGLPSKVDDVPSHVLT